MKYKVEDKVRVRRDLVVDKRYGDLTCLQDHKKECGKIFTIEDSDGYDYHLNGSDFWWSEEMLEKVDKMNYKVGDKVRVRKDLKAGSYYGKDLFLEEMKKYSGKIMTVDKITSTDKYKLKEDANHRNWTDEMLEDAEDIIILVKDNKVIAKMGNKVGIAKCSPEDEFDIFTGVRLAIDRLEEEYKPYSWLKEGIKYYYPCVDNDKLYNYFTYTNDYTDKIIISRGLVFKTKEEAIKVAKKMLEAV